MIKETISPVQNAGAQMSQEEKPSYMLTIKKTRYASTK